MVKAQPLWSTWLPAWPTTSSLHNYTVAQQLYLPCWAVKLVTTNAGGIKPMTFRNTSLWAIWSALSKTLFVYFVCLIWKKTANSKKQFEIFIDFLLHQWCSRNFRKACYGHSANLWHQKTEDCYVFQQNLIKNRSCLLRGTT